MLGLPISFGCPVPLSTRLESRSGGSASMPRLHLFMGSWQGQFLRICKPGNGAIACLEIGVNLTYRVSLFTHTRTHTHTHTHTRQKQMLRVCGLRSGRMIPITWGKGHRFPGIGPPSSFWSFMPGLRTVMVLVGVLFRC